MSRAFGKKSDGKTRKIRQSLTLAIVVAFFLFSAAAWAATQTPKFSTLYLRGAQDCLPQSPSAGCAGGRVFSDLLSFRVQAMDDKTVVLQESLLRYTPLVISSNSLRESYS